MKKRKITVFSLSEVQRVIKFFSNKHVEIKHIESYFNNDKLNISYCRRCAGQGYFYSEEKGIVECCA